MWLEVGWAEIILGLAIFLPTVYVLRRHIFGLYDPMVLQSLLISLSVSAYLISVDRGVNYEKGLYLLLAYYLAIFLYVTIARAPVYAKPPVLALSRSFQVYLASVILIVLVLVVVVNYIFGYSPILQGGGNESRVLVSGNNRILEYAGRLLPAISTILFASSIPAVRRLSAFSLMLGATIFILQGNRAGIIFPILLLLRVIFVQEYFRVGLRLVARLKKSIVILGVVVAVALPAYISSISLIGSDLVYKLVLSRLFLSLDGLFTAGWADMDVYNPNISLLVLYLQPIFKVFSVTNGEYNSVMDYVNYVQNALIPGTYNGPTDNIFVEMMVGFDGVLAASFAVFVVTLAFLFWRNYVVRMRRVGVIGLGLMSLILLNPLGFVTLGYLTTVDFIFLVCISTALVAPYYLLRYVGRGLRVSRRAVDHVAGEVTAPKFLRHEPGQGN